MRRPLLLPLVPLYAAGLALKRRLLESRPGYARWLVGPVISVGSLSAGGAGKTPVVEALARLLLRHGYTVDVLSRGYGRAARTVERVDPAGTPDRFGDEPLLLASGLGVPVFVGADRYAAGLLAQSQMPGGRYIHLLDDGFQHRRLGRSLDVVLLTAEDAGDCLLPVGNLREPLRRLAQAGAIVVRDEEEPSLRPLLDRLRSAETPLWRVQRRLELTGLGAEPKMPLAFCGIARPENFFAMLHQVGLPAAETVIFPDHHPFRSSDIADLLQTAKRAGHDSFVTTAKDAVKLTPAMREQLEAFAPLRIAGLTVVFQDETAVLGGIMQALGVPPP